MVGSLEVEAPSEESLRKKLEPYEKKGWSPPFPFCPANCLGIHKFYPFPIKIVNLEDIK